MEPMNSSHPANPWPSLRAFILRTRTKSRSEEFCFPLHSIRRGMCNFAQADQIAMSRIARIGLEREVQLRVGEVRVSRSEAGGRPRLFDIITVEKVTVAGFELQPSRDG